MTSPNPTLNLRSWIRRRGLSSTFLQQYIKRLGVKCTWIIAQPQAPLDLSCRHQVWVWSSRVKSTVAGYLILVKACVRQQFLIYLEIYSTKCSLSRGNDFGTQTQDRLTATAGTNLVGAMALGSLNFGIWRRDFESHNWQGGGWVSISSLFCKKWKWLQSWN